MSEATTCSTRTAGRPGARFASATVTGPDLGLADAAATALAVAGDDGFEFVAALEGYEAFAVAFDGSTSASAAFPFAALSGAPPAG